MLEDLTRDPLLQNLARFTPASAGIDRYAMLFAAGRASAPKAYGWKLAAAALALAQVVTLAVWFAGSRSEATAQLALPPVVEQAPDVPDSPVSPALEPLPAASYGSLVRRWERDGLPPPAPVADPVPARPTLSIATSRGVLGMDY